MGLNIGIRVEKQEEGYMIDGRNPKGSIKNIEKRFFDFLHKKFPLGGFGGGWVNLYKDGYDFDVRMFSYASLFQDNGYTQDEMYLAIAEFIFKEFSHIAGIKMQTYWSG